MFKFGKLPRDQTFIYIAIAILFVIAFMCMQSPGSNVIAQYKPRRRKVLRYQTPNEDPEEPEEPSAGISGVDISSIDDMALVDSQLEMQNSCAAAGGVGLASSLLPREAASTENFGEFAPQDILKGQSFLSSREQVGIPETIGGALRNANQQIRAEPPAPKKSYVWQNSTIVPDTMQRPLI